MRMRKSARIRPSVERLEPLNLLSAAAHAAALAALAAHQPATPSGSIHVLGRQVENEQVAGLGTVSGFLATGSGTLPGFGHVSAIVEDPTDGSGLTVVLLAKNDTMALATQSTLPGPAGTVTTTYSIADSNGSMSGNEGTLAVSEAARLKLGQEYLTIRFS